MSVSFKIYVVDSDNRVTLESEERFEHIDDVFTYNASVSYNFDSLTARLSKLRHLRAREVVTIDFVVRAS